MVALPDHRHRSACVTTRSVRRLSILRTSPARALTARVLTHGTDPRYSPGRSPAPREGMSGHVIAFQRTQAAPI